MAYGRIAQEYQKHSVNGASPVQLIVMLYDGALRFMEQGRHAMAHADLERQNQCLQKAQRIVVELMGSLDMDRGGEIAENLFALYGYVLNELVLANMEDKPEPIERSIQVLSELRESWAALEKQAKSGDNPQTLAAAA